MATTTPFPASSRTSTLRSRVPSGSRHASGARPVRSPRSTSAAVRTPRATRQAAGIRLTRRGRVALATLAAGALSIMVVLSGQITADAGSQTAGPATSVVVVQSGDSLWSIAQEVAPAADPRETIARIRDLNGMRSATVIPGQSVVVPIHS